MLGCRSYFDATSNVAMTLVSTGGDGGRASWWLGKGIDVDAMLVVVMGRTFEPCVEDPSGKIGGGRG